MTIVCGTDFSELASGATLAAAQMAIASKRPLHLLHALERFEDSESRRGDDLAVLAKGVLERRAAHLRKLGAEVDVHIASASPDDALLELARSVDASLIVVGAVGARGSKARPVGAHADRLAQRSHLPVLTVRDGAPFVAWIRDQRALRITLGVDFTESSDFATRWVATIRRYGPCELVAVHAYSPPEQHYRLGLPAVMNYGEADGVIHAALERDISNRLAETLGSPPSKIRIAPCYGRRGDRLVELAETELADLVVVGRHARGPIARLWEGSVSHRVLHEAKSSVACVPSPREALARPVHRARRVIAATDFSPAGNEAVARAYGLVDRDGTVLLLHTIEQTPDPDVAARLRALVPRDAPSRGIRTEVRVVVASDPAREICATAELLDADVVCIGKHKHPEIAEMMLGSVARYVVASSPRPVLLCRARPE